MSQKAAAQLREQITRGLRCGARQVSWVLCCAALALSRGAVASTGLTLETGSPDALCPALPTAREAVERRLGTLVVSSGAGWRARYTIAHAPEGAQTDFVRLELFAPDNTLQLSRDLPLESGACSTVAEAIALVLDRYFRKLPLGGAGAEPAAAAEPAAGAAAAPAALAAPAPSLPAATTTAADEGAPAAPFRDAPPDALPAPERETFQPFWRVGAAFATGTAGGPAVSLEALRESVRHLYTGAELALDWDAGSQRWADGARVSSRSLGGALTVGWGTRWRALRGYLGPTVRLSWERAEARGLEQSSERDRARAAAGVRLGVVAGLPRRWSLSLTAGLEANLGASQFRVDRQEVLRPAPLEGRWALGLGYGSGL